jgi:hypothetical protein
MSNTTTQPLISENNESPQWKHTKLTKEVITAQGNKIRLVDTDPENKLDLFCFVRCVDETDEVVKACRGVVVYDEKVIVQTYGYTGEFTTDDKSKLETMFPDTTKLTIQEAHEGSLLRVFSVNNKWYVTTHRKLDAFRSKWSSRQSFGEQFVDAIESEYNSTPSFKERCDGGTTEGVTVFSLKENETVKNEIMCKFFSTLDTTKCYCFLVRNTAENRIVCQKPVRATVFHSGTFSTTDPDYFSLSDDVGIPTAKAHTFDSWDSITNYITNDIYEDELQGLIVFDGKNHVKIFSKKYKHLFTVRGNEPSIKYRYLQIRMDKTMTDDLYSLYPTETETFEEYENILYNVAKNIYASYVSRFIKKQYVTLPKEEFQIMRECHSWHLADREKNRMSLRKVISIMNTQQPTNLNKMIRHVIQERTEAKATAEAAATLAALALSPTPGEAKVESPVEITE